MKHHCSVSNLLAAAKSLIGYAILIVAGFLAVTGFICLVFWMVSTLAFHKDLVVNNSTSAHVFMGLQAISCAGFIAWGLWKDWAKFLRGLVELVLKVGGAIGLFAYIEWVTNVVPTVSAHPLTLFTVRNVSYLVHIGLLPARAATVIAAIALVFGVCMMVYYGFRNLCQYGGELREAKAKKQLPAATTA